MNYINPNSNRVVEIKAGDNIWVQVEFEQLKKGCIFRMFEDKDRKNPVTNWDGITEFYATSDPYLNENNLGYNVLVIDTLA